MPELIMMGLDEIQGHLLPSVLRKNGVKDPEAFLKAHQVKATWNKVNGALAVSLSFSPKKAAPDA